MAALDIPPPPDGFTLDAGAIPPPPDGFALDAPANGNQEPTGFARTAGLTARSAINALTGLPSMVGDAANFITNQGIGGINTLTGSNIPKYDMLSAATSKAMDDIGLPRPKSLSDKLAEVGISALGGAGLARGAASMAKELPQLLPYLNFLGDSPLIQGIGALGGTLASEGARDAGIKNPGALGAIGMIGSLGAGGAGVVGPRGMSGILQAVQPFRNAGREVIVGKALNRVATNPSAAAETLAGAQEIVPGSKPMVSQASQDAGLISADSALRGLDDTGVIPGRVSEQNKARQDYLYTVAGDEAAVTAAKKHQQAAYDELAAPAFAAKQPIKIGREWIDNPVLRTIQQVRETPAGARQTVQNAMDHAQDMLTQKGVDLTDAETLYAIRKDLALARDGKLVGPSKSGIEQSNLKNARAQLNTVIDSLDDTIETGAPGFKEYLSTFHQRSIPLDQLKALQAIRSRAELAVSDPVTQTPILGNKFQTLLKNNLDGGLNLRGTGPKAGNLNGNQLGVLSRVAADLDRASAATAGTMKSPGSDTFKNMSIASVLGRVLGDQTGQNLAATTAGKTLSKGTLNPLAWLYHVPDKEIQQLMLQAWLDPKLASRLMKTATQHEVDSMAAELKNKFSKQMTAQAIYGGE